MENAELRKPVLQNEFFVLRSERLQNAYEQKRAAHVAKWWEDNRAWLAARGLTEKDGH